MSAVPVRVEQRAAPPAEQDGAPSKPLPREVEARPAADPPSIATPEPAPDPLKLVRDPRMPGYDAAKLFDVQGTDAMGIFEREPRDEAWAQQREADIMSAALAEMRDVDRDARMEVECHTSTCRVRVHSRNSYLTGEMDLYPLVCLANRTQPEFGDADAADPYSDFYLVFGSDPQNGSRHGDGFENHRENVCGRYRAAWRDKVRPKQ